MIWILLFFFFLSLPTYALSIDPLPSWNQGKTKQAIIDFVKDVTDKKSKFYVPPEKRIAVFDNDGTLWCEKPIYPQFVFACDRYAQIENGDRKNLKDPVFELAKKKDYLALAATGSKGIQKIVGRTHGGMTSVQFEKTVIDWINTSKHPKFKHKFTDCVYKPMKEVLGYLRDNGFKTFIVSGGGRDFMRPWAAKTYGIQPYQIVGSSCEIKFQKEKDQISIVRTNKIEILNDGTEKPVGIQKYIGMKPIAAFGNSDGDLEMLQWTSQGSGRSLCAIVHHTDSEREYAYDRKSSVGHLDKALDRAKKKDWILIDMKADWSEVFPFDNETK